MAPIIGTTIAGRYRILAEVGQGGMGTVYRAIQENLGREVALKLIQPQHLSSEGAVARFEREARTIAKLNHPNIVTIHDFGSLDDGGLFIVMELLVGHSLGSAITRRPVEWPRSLLIIRDVANALAAAHAHKIVHRDLKPDNIMLVGSEANEVAKVLDFGIAKLNDSAEERAATITEAGIIVGTPAYMAPEVIMGESRGDGRADLFSLGLVWHEMLTGKRVFSAVQPSAALVQAASQPIPTPASLGLALPDSVATILMDLVARPLESRTPSAEALLEQLERCIQQTASGSFPFPPRLAAVVAEKALRQTFSDDDDDEHDADTEKVRGLARVPGPGTMPLGSIGGANAMREVAHAETAISRTPATGSGGIAGPMSVPERRRGLLMGLAVAALLGVGVAIAGVAVQMRGDPDEGQPQGLVATGVATTAPLPPVPASPQIARDPIAALAADAGLAADATDLVDEAADEAIAAVDGAAAQDAAAPPDDIDAKPAPKASPASTKPSRPPPKRRPRVVVEAPPPGPQPLTSDAVEAALQSLLGKAGACRNTNITNARQGGGLLVDHCPSYKTVESSQQLLVTIDPSGEVKGVRFRNQSLSSTSDIAACILKSVKLWRFPAFAGETVEIGQRVTFKPCVPINNKCVFVK